MSQANPRSGCSNFAQVGSVTDSPYLDTGLAAGTTYRYRVRATDAANNLSGYSAVSSATTLAAPPSGGRVGIYPFDEGSGDTAGDLSDLHNAGVRNGPTWTTAGKYGNALIFTTSNYLDLNNPGMLQMTGSMTISAWINPSSFPDDDAAIVSKRTGSDNQGFQLDTTIDMGPRTIGFKLTTPAGEKMFRYGATTLQPNTWYHVAGVYDAQAQTLNVYLNAVLDNGPAVGAVASSQMDRNIDVNVGKRPGSSGYEFLGTLDEVRIYSRVLSQAEIQADMNTPASGGPAPDTTPPSAPSGLAANAASATQINLSWTASTDNVAVTGYLLERCQGAGCSNFAQIATPTATTFSDTNLLAATSYSYRVRASDAAANLSAYSNTATATTSTAQAQMYFIEPDHLNTPRMISSQSGTTVWRWDQAEPFGDSVPNSDADGDGVAFDFPMRFPGQYADRETGKFYNWNRIYEPSEGRYLLSDPIGLRGGLNTYSYVRGNPISYFDPLGLEIEWKGNLYSIGATWGLGGQVTLFKLTSECKCGVKYTISGFASFVTIGVGASLKGVGDFLKDISGTGSPIELSDRWADCPDPSAATGPAWTSGINIVIGAGGTILGRTKLGRLGTYSGVDGPSYGFDVSLTSTFWGQSAVTDVKPEKCCKN